MMKDIDNWFVIDERPRRGDRKKSHRRTKAQRGLKQARGRMKKEKRVKTRAVVKTERRRLPAVLAAIAVVAAAAFFCEGILTADFNSRATGWGDERTELAFAVNGDTLTVTVMGSQVQVDASPLKDIARSAATAAERIGSGLRLLRPAPERLASMAAESLRPSAERTARDFVQALLSL